MAGGQRIDNHANWTGPAQKGEVFARGAKTKMESSAEGDGALNQYYDSSEKIKEQQMMGHKKAKGHAMKPGYRY